MYTICQTAGLGRDCVSVMLSLLWPSSPVEGQLVVSLSISCSTLVLIIFLFCFVFLDGLAKKFGLTPEQFGENLRDSYQRHETEQFPAEPLELAKDYVCRSVAGELR